MDERRVGDLFREAVRDVPPPTFDARSVTAESARLTRKRNGIIAGSALGFGLLAGGIAVGMALLTGPSGGDLTAMSPTSASDGNESLAPYEVPDSGSDSGTERGEAAEEDHSPATPKQGGSSGEDADPSAVGGTYASGCGTAAREFAAALAGELPAATSLGDPTSSPLTCPAGATSLAYPVAEGPEKGLLSVMVVPADSPPALQPPWIDRPDGTVGSVAQASDGRMVVVAVEPVPGSAQIPLAVEDTRRLAEAIAAEL